MIEEILLLEDFSLPTLTFSEFREIKESYHNLLRSDKEEKLAHAQEVYDLLGKSYASQGGIKGNGFNSPEDMVHIPMWKLAKQDGKVKAAVLYKDDGEHGRKLVAAGTDGSISGKRKVADILTSELKKTRSFMEVSGNALKAMKHLTDITPYVHKYETAEKFHASRGDSISKPSDEDKEVVLHPEFKDNFYVRKIGGEPHTKLMVGFYGNKIHESFTPRTKEDEIINGKDSALSQEKQKFDSGKWEFDPQIHGPSQAKDRRPNWSSDDWNELLDRSHQALTKPAMQVVSKGKQRISITPDKPVVVYSLKKQQGVLLHMEPKIPMTVKGGGRTRLGTILPPGKSFADSGTQRIVIENVETEVQVIIIE